jgi:hypothetical protein
MGVREDEVERPPRDALLGSTQGRYLTVDVVEIERAAAAFDATWLPVVELAREVVRLRDFRDWRWRGRKRFLPFG